MIEENEPIDPKIAKVIQGARTDMQMQKDAAERVREKVRRRGGSAASEARALRALAQAFRDQGMDISALSDLLGSPFFEAFSTLVSAFDSQSRNPAGEEGVKAYLNIPQIMDIGRRRGISPNDFQSTFTASLKLVQDFATRASATAQPLWEWVGRNPEAAVDGICLAATIWNWIPIIGESVPAPVGTLCGLRTIDKVLAFAGARAGTGTGAGSGTGSGTGTGGSHTTLLPTQGSTSRTCPNTLFSSRNNTGSGAQTGQTGQSGGQVGSSQPNQSHGPTKERSQTIGKNNEIPKQGTHQETYSNQAVQQSDSLKRWNDFLGEKPHNNIHPKCIVPDCDGLDEG